METTDIQNQSLMKSLKEQTAALHEEIELCLPVENNAFDMHYYGEVLKKFARFFAAYEPHIQSILLGSSLEDFFADRLKLPLLQKDLKELGLAYTTPAPVDLSYIHNLPTAIGSLYVIEGSTLGGQVLTRALKKKFNLEESQIHYFGGYKERTGPMWMEFKSLVDSMPYYEIQRAEVISAANQTFRTLIDNFREL